MKIETCGETSDLFIPYLESGEFDALAQGLAEPSANWWHEIPLGIERAVCVYAVVERREYEGWGRVLSAHGGGFCVARPGLDAPLAVFYSGQRLMATGDTWESLYETLCGVAWRQDRVALLATARRSEQAAPVLIDRTWTRAAFQNVRPPVLESAAAAASAEGLHLEGWRWLVRHTPVAGLDLILLETHGSSDPALLESLAKRMNAYGAAIEFRPDGTALTWWYDASGLLRTGTEPFASGVIAIFRDLAVTMGEGAGVIRWPQRERGLELAANATGKR